MAWLWLSLLILSVVVAVITKKNVFASFAPSALICSILDFFNVFIVVQVVVYVIATVVFACAYYLVILKYVNNSGKSLSIDAVVGEKCVVVEKIDNYAGCGLVRIGRQLWSARGAYEEDSFEIGESLIVVAIEGVKLICKKA